MPVEGFEPRPENVPLKQYNRLLAERYGYADEEHQTWRLAWTSEEFETKHGNFIDWGGPGGDVLIRKEENVVRRVPKYPFAKNRWVLEKFVPRPHPDLVLLTKGSYEIACIFEGKDRQPLPVWWEAIEFYIKMATQGPAKCAEDGDDVKYRKEIDLIMDILDGQSGEFGIAEGSGVGQAGGSAKQVIE